MSNVMRGQTLQDASALLALLEADSLQGASEVISEETELDAHLAMDGADLVLRMGRIGTQVDFPLTEAEFWDLVDDLEQQVIADIDQEVSSQAEPISWDDPALFPNESKRTGRYRRLQSWYREFVLGVQPGPFMNYPALGSYLRTEDVAENPRLNFLGEAAFEHALERIATVREEGGALDPIRLKHNMLSSMPMCFNLFGTMRAEPDFLVLFRQLFDESATEITDVVCEWAPQPPGEFLDDRTAFDAIVFYRTPGQQRFCGIETKYTEPFSAKKYESATYSRVTRESGWFSDSETAPSQLKDPASNQLWRNLLLAASVEKIRQAPSTGWVAVVALEDDAGAARAIDRILPTLAEGEPRRLRFVSFEAIVQTAETIPSLRAWAAEFRRRYLGLVPD